MVRAGARSRVGGRGCAIAAVDEDTVVVFRAGRDLAAGSPIDGLVGVRVSRAAIGDRYLMGQPDAGSTLRWPIAEGEFVPRSALVDETSGDLREVAVPVDPLRAPSGLAAGDLVDVWSSPRESESGLPRLVLANVTVADIATDDLGIDGDMAVVLSVPVDAVAGVVAASRSDVVDLVAVPIGSQSPIGVPS